MNRERESSKRPGEEGQGANEVDAPVIDEPAAEEGFREPEGSPPGESGETTQAPAPLGQALAELPAPPGTAPGTVLQVVTGGYSRNGRALRAARVVVARSDDEA